MLDPDGGQTKTGGFEPIKPHQGSAATPTKLVYARFGLSQVSTIFKFTAVRRGLVQGDDADTDKLCNKRKGKPSQTDEVDVGPVPKDSKCSAIEIGDTDIPINGITRVFIELDPGVAWQFRTSGPAVTQKEAYVTKKGDTSNQDLVHVNPTAGNTPDQPAENGCRLVFFDVVARDGCDRQSFNLHVELIQDFATNTSVDIIFDPDVPDTGGEFPFLDV